MLFSGNLAWAFHAVFKPPLAIESCSHMDNSAIQYRDFIEPEFIASHNFCKPYTMTSTERLYALFNAVNFVVKAGVEGDFVECGVWKGGSVMMIALALKMMGV